MSARCIHKRSVENDRNLAGITWFLFDDPNNEVLMIIIEVICIVISDRTGMKLEQ